MAGCRGLAPSPGNESAFRLVADRSHHHQPRAGDLVVELASDHADR
jgi:hypothetical protein